MKKLTITRPDDWHLHLRDGEALKAVLPYTVNQFARAIVMPNLKPPVRSVADAAAYRDRIVAAIPDGQQFEPLMTLYLTDNTSPEDIIAAKESQFVKAVKYYPAGHKKEKITEFDLVYWRNWFSETKKNRARKKFPKGFIELKFGNKKSN